MSIPSLEEGTKEAAKLIAGLQQSDQEAANPSEFRDPQVEFEESLKSPYSDEVTLPGGYIDEDGFRQQKAVIRELTGKDEEIIAKYANRIKDSKDGDIYGRTLVKAIELAVVQVGDEQCTPRILDEMCMADWDALLLGIYISTYGDEITWRIECPHCNEVGLHDFLASDTAKPKTVPDIEVEVDIETNQGTVIASVPTGAIARRVLEDKFSTASEFLTMVLKGTVQSVNGVPMIKQDQIKAMSIKDRRKILSAVDGISPLLNTEVVKTTCRKCEGDIQTTVSLAAMFRSEGLGL